jgi:hypothetical protein
MSKTESAMPDLDAATVEAEFEKILCQVGGILDAMFNGPPQGPQKRGIGFALLVFPFGGEVGRCNYISNANRADVIRMLREHLDSFDLESAQAAAPPAWPTPDA